MTMGRRRCLTVAKGSVLALCGANVLEREAAAQAEPARLQAADLQKFLTNLGFDVKDAGSGSQRITVERGKFTFRINTSVSGNGKKVWLSTYLLQLPDEKRTAEYLTKLLAANTDTGPAHFSLVTIDGKTWLKMGYALDNRDITPKYYRDEFDWFCERISDQEKLWSAS